ncbi:probable enoyl-CoA hydratase, mitochondrial [Daktulosphaira vitifoliae]|uniref:probable enoyl-CoA hydratase, mitochondrial n=1 Tax=Daktulosphaira vitifoliae TaxID=58002 RepID=UPI0021AA764C|nr:probable enoyl-CoA hydratase, mitochondrial [Daktulosphaira vitifoliae]
MPVQLKFLNSTKLWNFFIEPSKHIKFCSSYIHNKNLSDMDEDSTIKVYEHQHITLIGLNRPDNKNKLNLSLINGLYKAIKDFESNNSSTIAILYGEGGSFCAGFETDKLKETFEMYNEFMLINCQKPIIAAVSGFAYNAGFHLSLWCDLRIIEENAVLSVDRKCDTSLSKNFYNKLLMSVGYSRALDLILTGRDLYSKEAFECGIANRVVACGSGVGQAVNMAANIGKFHQKNIIEEKQILNRFLKSQ